ncbi:MAG: hypothetical protein DWI00_16995 [Planctomycetota bacterium]|nr:MAG: hypothetical protein DWI00_16995 [Planctomycetota bacterium]
MYEPSDRRNFGQTAESPSLDKTWASPHHGFADRATKLSPREGRKSLPKKTILLMSEDSSPPALLPEYRRRRALRREDSSTTNHPVLHVYRDERLGTAGRAASCGLFLVAKHRLWQSRVMEGTEG